MLTPNQINSNNTIPRRVMRNLNGLLRLDKKYYINNTLDVQKALNSGKLSVYIINSNTITENFYITDKKRISKALIYSEYKIFVKIHVDNYDTIFAIEDNSTNRKTEDRLYKALYLENQITILKHSNLLTKQEIDCIDEEGVYNFSEDIISSRTEQQRIAKLLYKLKLLSPTAIKLMEDGKTLNLYSLIKSLLQK